MARVRGWYGPSIRAHEDSRTVTLTRFGALYQLKELGPPSGGEWQPLVRSLALGEWGRGTGASGDSVTRL